MKEAWTVQKVFITATARTKESILIGFEEGGGGRKTIISLECFELTYY